MVIAPTDIAIAIKTHPRAGVNYLHATLANLARACGGDLPGPLAISDGSGLTLHQNAAHAIRLGVDANRPWVLVLEDDLDFCADFLGSVARWLGEHEDPRYPMYVFGANYEQIERRWARGATSWEYPCSAFYGAQALCWRREEAQHLIGWLGDDPHYNGVRDHGHDLLLQRWGKERWEARGSGERPPFFLASCPSFVDHVGEQSGIGNRFFRFGSWQGREWSYSGKAAGR